MTVSILKQRAIFGDVCQRGLRSVCWKIYLGYLETLDPSNWMLPLEKERQHYEQLRKKHIVDPNTTNEDTNGTGVRKIVEHHPLSLDETSPWSQFFQDTELRRIIKQDVERTFPDNPYFRKPITQERMTDILFVYCKIHSDVSYRQGMHELLAPILMVVDNDALDPEECVDTDDPDMAKYMSITLNKEFVEHDAFVLFSSVMATAKQWYEFTEEPRRPSVNRTALVSPRSAKFEQLNEMANSSTPILRISHRIHHELLKTIDNDLYEHLEQLAIEPQIYAIRWLRLLFGREFPLADVYCLWDALFADDRSLGAVEYVCISMSLFIREELLSEDYSGCLHQLMRYPTVSDITIFVKQAVHLRQNPLKRQATRFDIVMPCARVKKRNGRSGKRSENVYVSKSWRNSNKCRIHVNKLNGKSAMLSARLEIA
ncbi:rab-GTPase-TBC domain-containing protein [Syncephalis plumigaleata]|nr:rab-GTPase-TBC domain-containing protein [Syncephalis plumigaleata]